MKECRMKFMATGKASGKNFEMAMRAVLDASAKGADKITLEVVDCDRLAKLDRVAEAACDLIRWAKDSGNSLQYGPLANAVAALEESK